MKYLESYKESRKINWFLICDNFNELLDRIDEKGNTRYLRKRYPSSYTYNKMKRQLNYDVLVEEYDEIIFKKYYDDLKPDRFQSSDEKLLGISKFVGRKYIFKLECSQSVVAIAVVRIESKQLDYIAPVASRSKHSYGLILLMEIIRYGIENRRVYRFSGGKTKYYPYKEKVFLDSRELYGELLFALCKTIVKKLRKHDSEN